MAMIAVEQHGAEDFAVHVGLNNIIARATSPSVSLSLASSPTVGTIVDLHAGQAGQLQSSSALEYDPFPKTV
jgi:hypothetical protein